MIQRNATDRSAAKTRGIACVSIAALAALSVSSCVLAPDPVNPMPSISSPVGVDEQTTLLVMLPGRGDRMTAFLDAGFVSAAAGQNFDVLITDAHYGYYLDRSMTTRLHEDVILPALAQGYEDIWLLGISMGGFGAILYASEHPNVIRGVVLLAPYVGDSRLVEEISEAGGLATWSGESNRAPEYEIEAWKWLQRAVVDPATDVVLAYGTDDSLADRYGPLIEILPSSRMFTQPGGHRWVTWTPLWSQILNQRIIL